MSARKKIIFFPIEVGVAHIVRSLAIAEEAQKRGHQVLFALSKSKEDLVKNSNIEVVTIKEFFPDEESAEIAKDAPYLATFIPQELEILKAFKPDLAVNDLRMSALVSCKLANIPVFFISNTDGLPVKFYLPNANFPKFFYKLALPLVQSSLAKFKSQYFSSLVKAASLIGFKITKDELFKMTYIVPETEDYLPVSEKIIDINYVGPIIWKGFEQIRPPWFNFIKPDGKTIYLTFGGTGYDGAKLVSLSKILVEKGYRVIVSSSNIIDESAFPKMPNLYVAKYLPGLEVCRRVDLMVCHGGIGTLIQAVLAGKVSVSVPFNPDQYLHGLRFQELGLGICVSGINILDLLRLNWDLFTRRGRSVPVAKIVEAVDQAISQKERFAETVEQFRSKLPLNGHIRAVDIIEKLG